MRVELTRSGGLAGLRLHSALDTEQLSQAEAQEVAKLVERANFEELSRRSPIRGPGADRFQYDLTVRRGDRTQHVSMSEGQVPAQLRPLVEHLLKQPKRG